MSSRRQAATERLRDVVDSYWVAGRDLSADGGFLVTPDRFVDLLFTDEVIHIDGGGRYEPLPRCSLLGLLDEPVRLASAGRVRCAGIRMQAWVKGLCFPADPAGPWRDAGPVVDWNAPAIFAALRENQTERLFQLLEGLVEDLLAPSLTRLDACAEIFSGREGSLSLHALSRRLGTSPRQTERRVKALTHVSPKQLASLARFQTVRDRLWLDPAGSLSRIALEAGYADQSHMTREFRRYAGMTPRAFARTMGRPSPELGR